MNFNRLKITKLIDNAELGIVGALDVDTGGIAELRYLELYSTKKVIVQYRQQAKLHFGFSITIPEGYKGCPCLEEPFDRFFYLTDLDFTSNPNKLSTFELTNCREERVIIPPLVRFATMSFHEVKQWTTNF